LITPGPAASSATSPRKVKSPSLIRCDKQTACSPEIACQSALEWPRRYRSSDPSFHLRGGLIGTEALQLSVEPSSSPMDRKPAVPHPAPPASS
jgi:hypothetical protein